ncbi:MAG: hypothetical protein GWM98_18115, partial [Nitrospinaceae bacterium]|nr:hypothetical protein [Nitrospinaceae bacterium]NIR56059.1 hypothetical protein [Nitrospinaceae bacterium]NIS86504.1 hypothetical protein [Nitrospinaceae bacterium]NIT83339.1 hypothetical protein [Nitrospinaceae bacterium]NIU45548.1 hypothetical protein [Nitrospinaceae bacterium]
QPAPAETQTAPASEETSPEEETEEIDLNHLFPDEDKDLNDLFPEPELRTLLKKVQRNKKDLNRMKGRFSENFNAGETE